MKFCKLLLLFMLIICGCKNINNSVTENLEEVILSEDKLIESHFSSKVIPNCVIELAPLYNENQCFKDATEIEGNEYKIIHARFLKSLNRLEHNGGGLNLPKEKYALYNEAICTLGIMRSCALNNILIESDLHVSVDKVMFLLSGEAIKYHKELIGFYPENYDPRIYEQFYAVLVKGMKIISIKNKSFEENF